MLGPKKYVSMLLLYPNIFQIFLHPSWHFTNPNFFVCKFDFQNWNILLTCRILFSLLKTHHNQIVSNRMMRPLLDSIRFHLREQLKRQKNTMGYNIAALRYIRRDWENRNIAEFWDEDDQKKEDGTKKRKFVTVTV